MRKLSIYILLLLNSGSGTESAWIRVISLILWVQIMHPGYHRKQKCSHLSTMLALSCWSSAAHPKPTHTPAEAERKDRGTL